MFLFLYETDVGSLEMFEFEVDDALSLVTEKIYLNSNWTKQDGLPIKALSIWLHNKRQTRRIYMQFLLRFFIYKKKESSLRLIGHTRVGDFDCWFIVVHIYQCLEIIYTVIEILLCVKSRTKILLDYSVL